jgi:hypothetical protein
MDEGLTTEQIFREHYRLVEACHEPSNDGSSMRAFKGKVWVEKEALDAWKHIAKTEIAQKQAAQLELIKLKETNKDEMHNLSKGNTGRL